MKIREIIFFTYGDSAKASTWSNVPYLFTETLIMKGIIVDRVDLSQTPFNKLLTKVGGGMRRLLNIFYPNNRYAYFRSRLCVYLTNKLVKRSVKRYYKADLCVFTNFDFYNKYSEIPSLMFCDWTYKTLIEDHLERKLYFFEKHYSIWEKKAIEHADYIVSLFPVCAKMIKEDIPSANVFYLGSNVVNSLYDGVHNVEAFIKKKRSHKNILFIGGSHYHNGAVLIIEAVKQLHAKYKDIYLDIVGMNKNMFYNLPEYVHCHGYLRKDIKKERELYYDLLIGASLLSNPSKKWAGYSSTIEAMYFATPIVVSPYKDFIYEFGKDISFGAYNKEYTPESLAKIIESIITSREYPKICRNAYESVKDYTWDKYVDKIIKLVTKSCDDNHAQNC